MVCSSCLKHANEMLLGDPRQADQRMQSFNFPILIHQSLDPAAQGPHSVSLHACVNQSSIAAVRFLAPMSALERALARLWLSQSISERDATTQRATISRGDHMRNHLQFQRDIDDVTEVSLSFSVSVSLSLSLCYSRKKVLTHNIPGAFVPGIILAGQPGVAWAFALRTTGWPERRSLKGRGCSGTSGIVVLLFKQPRPNLSQNHYAISKLCKICINQSSFLDLGNDDSHNHERGQRNNQSFSKIEDTSMTEITAVTSTSRDATRSRIRDMDEKPPKTLFYPTRSALTKHNFFRRSKF